MDTNEDKLLLQQGVFQIVSCAIEILNTLGFDSVVVDTKVIDRIADHERGLMLNYLGITNLRVGVILNFKRAKLQWERIVL
jgi:hypothetical protein